MCGDDDLTVKQAQDKLEPLLEPYEVFLGSSNPLSRKNDTVEEREGKNEKGK